MANTNLFKIFIAVADNQSITKASEKLYISQPAVTKSIKQLEAELGGKLFIRKNKGVYLTTEGEHIYNEVKPLLNGINNVYSYFSNVKKIKTGVLRIGTTTSNITILLEDALNQFVTGFPSIEVKITRGKEASLISKLRNNQLDLAIIDSDQIPSDLATVKNFNVYYNVVGDYSYAKKFQDNPMTEDDFASCPLALINSGHTSRKNVDSYFSERGITLYPRYETEDYGFIMNFIKRGVAIGVINPEYFQDELNNNQIFKLNTTFDIGKRTISLIKSSKPNNNPARDVFLSYLSR